MRNLASSSVSVWHPTPNAKSWLNSPSFASFDAMTPARSCAGSPALEDASTGRRIQRRGGMAKMVMGAALAAACAVKRGGLVRGRGKPAAPAAGTTELDLEMAALSLKAKVAEAVPTGPASAAGTEAGPILEKLMGMSLEEDRKRAALELVAIVTRVGVAAIESMGISASLATALQETGKAGAMRAGAMAAVDALHFKLGSAFEPWAVKLLPHIFDTAGHKNGGVAKIAIELGIKVRLEAGTGSNFNVGL
ncbi:hypothetical protein T484DRAFT_1851383 [Baffinella frigidus]|nr:hypothetical protein T484DRAFT_1851383 [Cryptophyta sp. CCMP2293]